jgi:hypothetical protein
VRSPLRLRCWSLLVAVLAAGAAAACAEAQAPSNTPGPPATSVPATPPVTSAPPPASAPVLPPPVTPVLPPPASQVSPARPASVDPATRAAAERKINSRILQEIRRAEGGGASRGAPSGPTGVRIDAEKRAFVDVRADLSPALLTTLAGLGATVVSSSARDRSVLAWVPLAQIHRLASDAAVVAIEPAAEAMTNAMTGGVTGGAQAVDQLLASRADVVVTDMSSAAPVTVKVGQTLGIVGDSSNAVWQVDHTGESLRLLTPVGKVSQPGVAGWVWRAIAPGTSEITLVSRVQCPNPPCAGNPARYGMTVEIIRP